ncbi:MAG TPA: SDR family NAD(P)-dependent oxidoreductase [Stellaceae bacterium]|nr:SDR family NAD(P)-dependent oxidoreductase [Stellaceae bacterium]
MQDFAGRGAFVTGGASGIGLALGRAFAASGMKVMLADLDEDRLDRAVRRLHQTGAAVEGVLCDVSDRAAVMAAAEKTFAAFGKVHVVCNNAGVGGGGPIHEVRPTDWEWVIGVDLMGVIHGLQAFLPHLKAHGEPAHIVNTGSMAGMLSPPGMAPYNVSKHAVVTLSETLAAELAGTSIRVSVLCPGWVKTRIHESARHRPARFGPPRETPLGVIDRAAQIAEQLRAGMSPDEVAARVMAAIRDGDLHIFTHAEMRPALEERFRRILAAYDKAAAFKR